MSNKKGKIAALAVVLACLTAPSIGELPVLASDYEKAVALSDEQIENKSYVIAKVLIKAKPDHVWQILTDFNSAPNVFPTLKKCQVLCDKGATKLIHYQVKPTGVPSSFSYDLEVREHGRNKMEWRRVDGDFKEVIGYWKLDSAESGQSTLVTYASYVNGGIFMPQALIKRQSRIDVPPMMAALKTHAETLQIASSRPHTSHRSD